MSDKASKNCFNKASIYDKYEISFMTIMYIFQADHSLVRLVLFLAVLYFEKSSAYDTDESQWETCSHVVFKELFIGVF